jgi:hypothetical protein
MTASEVVQTTKSSIRSAAVLPGAGLARAQAPMVKANLAVSEHLHDDSERGTWASCTDAQA